MDNSVFRISLDVHRQTTQAHPTVKKGDTARTIIASLSDGGKPYQIAEGCYAVFLAQKPDGNVLYNDCRIENNQIVYDFTEQTVSAAGRMPCELRLYGADDKVITSPKIAIIVSGTVYEDSQVESTSEFTALSRAMTDVAELKKTGLKGDPGDNVELRYVDHQVQWRYAAAEGEPEEEWQALFSSDEVRDQVVQMTLDEAQGYANNAAASAELANELATSAQGYCDELYNDCLDIKASAEQSAAAAKASFEAAHEHREWAEEEADNARQYAEQAAAYGVHRGAEAPVTEAAIWVKDDSEGNGCTLIARQEVSAEGSTVIDFSGLELSSFALYAYAAQGSADISGSAYVYKDGVQVWAPWVNKIVSSTEPRTMTMYGENRQGIAVLELVPPAAATSTQSRYPNRCPNYIEGNTPFTRVMIKPSGGASLPEGCVFELWGKKDASNILYRDVNGAYVPYTGEGVSMEVASIWSAIHDLQRKVLDHPVLMAGGNLPIAAQAFANLSPGTLAEVAFVDSYAPTGDESASAPMDVGGTGSITGYLIGNKLIIAGNGSGRIRLHADCRNLLAGLVNCTAITGLELLDASAVTSFRGAFARCRGLTQIDLSSWKVPCLTDMSGMFNFCDSLQRVIMPQYGIPATAATLSTFAECHALKTVSMGWGLTSLSNQVFHRCLNLESVTGLSCVEEIGDFAFVYTPKVRADLALDKIHTLGASAFRLSGMEDHKRFDLVDVPNVGQSATRQARWDAERLAAIRDVKMPDVHIEVPNPDSISNYTKIPYVAAEHTEDGQVGMISRYGCAAMTLYHIWQAYYASREPGMLYPNFGEWWDDVINPEGDWLEVCTLGNHIPEMVRRLGWGEPAQLKIMDSGAKEKLGELLSAGQVVFVNMVSSRPDGTVHAVAVIGSDSSTGKLEVLDSSNYDSGSVHPWVSWMSFEDMFTQAEVDVNADDKTGTEYICLINFGEE